MHCPCAAASRNSASACAASPERRSRSAAVSRDLPMPASPESNTTCPSPDLAVDHRRSSKSSSSSRPTRSVRPLVCMASKRPSTEAGRSAAQARTGPEIPLSSCGPRSSSSNKLPTSLRVLSATTTLFGSATPCKRAARFGVSPTMPCSCAAPDPIRSPTTTSPVAMPTRVCRGAGDFSAVNRRDQFQPRAHRPLGVVLMGLRIAEIDQHPVAHVLRHEAPKRRTVAATDF